MRVLGPDELIKEGAGTAESYLPWYAAAAGGSGGALLGEHLAKSRLGGRYRIPMLLAGTLLGTGLGVHGGEAAGRAIDRRVGRVKTAEEKRKEDSRLKKVLKVMGTSAGGFALGAGVGAGGGVLGSKLYRHATGKQIPLRTLAAVPALVGTGMGIAHPIMKHYERKELDRAFED